MGGSAIAARSPLRYCESCNYIPACNLRQADLSGGGTGHPTLLNARSLRKVTQSAEDVRFLSRAGAGAATLDLVPSVSTFGIMRDGLKVFLLLSTVRGVDRSGRPGHI